MAVRKKNQLCVLAQTTDCSDLMNTQEEAVENSHTKKPQLMSVLESLEAEEVWCQSCWGS